MTTFKKKDLNEMVGGDVFSVGSDRNVTNNSEIETGPVEKPYNDDSYYEKGMSTTSDRVFGRYRQNIPWFAVYSFGGTRTGRGLSSQVGMTEEKNIKTKNEIEEIIEDLVSKKEDNELISNKMDAKKVIKKFSKDELEKLRIAIDDELNNPTKKNTIK